MQHRAGKAYCVVTHTGEPCRQPRMIPQALCLSGLIRQDRYTIQNANNLVQSPDKNVAILLSRL
jgi:hypothetical protein